MDFWKGSGILWRYIRYLLLKDSNNLDLKIHSLGNLCFRLEVMSKNIQIDFMIPKHITRRDTKSDFIYILVGSLKRQIKQKLFEKNKPVKGKVCSRKRFQNNFNLLH